MSLAANMFAVQLNTRRASDAEFGMFQTADRMRNRVRQAGNSPSFGMNNLNQIRQQENRDLANMLTFGLMRRISQSMAESAKKMAKENTKSFDITG